MIIRAWKGDITSLEVDAVVNAANSELRRGGGVCGAIFAAAGPGLGEACAALGGCPTGSAVATGAFALACRWIIHAVGPVWHGGDLGEREQLDACYRSILSVAGELGAAVVAVPAISTGIYGFPADLAAEVAVAALRDAAPDEGDDPREVLLVAFDERTAALYEALLD